MRGSLIVAVGAAVLMCATVLISVVTPRTDTRISTLELEEFAELPGGRLVQERPVMQLMQRRPMRVPAVQAQGNVWRSQALVPGMMEPRMMLLSNKMETGQCMADASCGTDCTRCPGCQCLMGDGRNVECENGVCRCTAHCFCEENDECPKVCSMDYSPELCGEQFCRAGKCKEAFDLDVQDPEYRLPAL